MYLITVAVITMCAGLVCGQSSSCQTPDGKSGECISLLKCGSLHDLVNDPNKTDQELILLTKLHCGSVEGVPFVPKMCCVKQSKSEPVYSINSSCSTPDGRPGTCVGLHSCPRIENMLIPPVPQENIDFVKKSRCYSPSHHYSVCCDSNPQVERSDDCQTEMTAFPPNPSSGCCGESAGVGNKIIGGNVTLIDEYPWTVMVEYLRIDNSTSAVACGGTLISGKYVLTAAHCLTGAILNLFTPPTAVRLGEYDITNEGMDCVTVGGDEDCTDGVTRIEIERTIPHPKYRPGISKRDDIGLIRLKEAAPYTDFIRPVCLPAKDLTRPENTPPNFSMFAVGWGATEMETRSNVKLDVNLPFVSREKCQQNYNRAGRNTVLWRGQLCAGGKKNQDTCRGDSGGPLVYENQNKFEVIGITSFGPTVCGQKDLPGIYSNVHEYLDWIKSVIVS